MKRPMSGVGGRDHRIAIISVRDEVSRYWKTPALLATAVAAGIAFALPVASLHGRLALTPLSGGDLGLRWRAGVQPPAATQQQAVDVLSGLLLWSALGTLAIAAITILMLSLAREAERSGDVAVRRAVGAGRRILLGSGLLEGGLVALAGIVGGGMVGAGVAAAMTEWPGTLRPAALAWSGIAAAALVVVVLAGVSFPALSFRAGASARRSRIRRRR
jgi:predicted lysophospholipase L1 biosynthesis ABC-type transport system permease subunit